VPLPYLSYLLDLPFSLVRLLSVMSRVLLLTALVAGIAAVGLVMALTSLTGGIRRPSPTGWPYLQAADLVGDSTLVIQDRQQIDYIGWSPHGEIFTFDELDFDPTALRQVVRRSTFARHPSFTGFRHGYEARLKNVDQSAWRPTPLDAHTRENNGSLLQFANLSEYRRSSVVQHLAETPGCYYASFGGYPVGTVLCLLDPNTGHVYIIHKRG
jgi:hypothetical protein